MTTSGTYNFSPSLGELTLYAFNLAQVRPTSILQEHMQSARMSTNLMLADWANRGVNLWKVDLVTVPLVNNQTTYAVDPNVVMVLDAYITSPNSGQNIDRIILPISRTEYASYPNKQQTGVTTVYWFDRLINPTITLWPVPNDTTGYTSISYYVVRQIEDANVTDGQTVDIPYRWLNAFADGLAYHLARVWNPQIATILKPQADDSYAIAAQQDTEYVQMYVSPMVNGYWRP